MQRCAHALLVQALPAACKRSAWHACRGRVQHRLLAVQAQGPVAGAGLAGKPLRHGGSSGTSSGKSSGAGLLFRLPAVQRAAAQRARAAAEGPDVLSPPEPAVPASFKGLGVDDRLLVRPGRFLPPAHSACAPLHASARTGGCRAIAGAAGQQRNSEPARPQDPPAHLDSPRLTWTRPDSPLSQVPLADQSITEPTDVQRAAIPEILTGANVAVQSYTGSGKTLAYLLPVGFDLTRLASSQLTAAPVNGDGGVAQRRRASVGAWAHGSCGGEGRVGQAGGRAHCVRCCQSRGGTLAERSALAALTSACDPLWLAGAHRSCQWP